MVVGLNKKNENNIIPIFRAKILSVIKKTAKIIKICFWERLEFLNMNNPIFQNISINIRAPIIPPINVTSKYMLCALNTAFLFSLNQIKGWYFFSLEQFFICCSTSAGPTPKIMLFCKEYMAQSHICYLNASP